jgi:DNA ligase 1
MRLIDIVETSRRVGETRGRLEKIAHLADCLGRAEPGLIDAAIGLLTGEPRQGRIGLGPSTVYGAMSGPAAHEATLTLAEVDAVLDRLVEVRGPGSGAARSRLMSGLLARATAAEQAFLAGALLGGLRQGALEGLMVEAVARAAGLPVSEVRRALMVCGNLGTVARVALAEGGAGLGRFAIELFRPLKPMLAQTAEDPAEALAALGGSAAFEYKLDGARIQVHKQEQDVRVFSRTLKEVTASVPEVVEAVRALAAPTLILDGEALGLRRDGTPQPFQVTMRRFGRRLEVERLRETIPLRPFFFDCLLLDGEPLLDHPGEERIAALGRVLPPDLVIPRLVTRDAAVADAFLKEALDRGHEGLMAKSLTAPYEAGGRGGAWLKIKAAVTLDLVVLAAEWGHGRRTGWLSNLHLGARDPATGGFVMLGKTFKGMTDEMLAWQTEALQQIAVSRDSHVVHVEPKLVVEIAFNDIQASPHYPGGLALRFARVKGYRPDKPAEEADTIDTVRAIYERTTGRKSDPST